MKRLTVAAMVLTAGLAAAGCGDDDNGNNPTGPSTTGPISIHGSSSTVERRQRGAAHHQQ